MSERIKLQQIYPRPKCGNWHEDFGPFTDIKEILFPKGNLFEGDHGFMFPRIDGLELLLTTGYPTDSNNFWLGRIELPPDLPNTKVCMRIPQRAWVLNAENVGKIEVDNINKEVLFSLEKVTWMRDWKDWDENGDIVSLEEAQLVINGKGKVRLMSKVLEGVAEF